LGAGAADAVGAGAGSPVLIRRAITRPEHPAAGQAPRHVARFGGASVSMTCWQTGHSPLTATPMGTPRD